MNEPINADHFEFGPVDRKLVADDVRAILEHEGFFDHAPGDSDDGEEEETLSPGSLTPVRCSDRRIHDIGVSGPSGMTIPAASPMLDSTATEMKG